MSTATKQERQATTGGGELDRLLSKTVKYRPFGEAEDIELSFGQVKSYISAKTRNGNVATDADIIKFMMLCKARELNPWVGDAYLVGYDSKDGPTFSLITSIQALFKRAEANPHFDGIQSGVIVTGPDGKIVEREGDLVLPNEKLIGGWAKVYRKDRSQAFYDALNLATYDKGRSQWEKDKSGMIVKCAEASALRKAFPSQLSGLYVSQEQGLIAAANTASAPVHKPQPKTLSDLAQTLRQKPTTQAEPDSEPEPLIKEGTLAAFEMDLFKAQTEVEARDLYEIACNPDTGYLTSEDDVAAAGRYLTWKLAALKEAPNGDRPS